MTNDIGGLQHKATPKARILQVATVDLTFRLFLLPFGAHFRERGWKVDGLARGITSSDECRAAFDGVWESTWTRSPMTLANFTTAPRIIRRVALAGKYEIVHVHTPIAALITRWALRKQKRNGSVTVIYTAHGFHFHEGGSKLSNALFKAAERIAGKWTNHLVVLTEKDFRAAEKLKLVPMERLHLIRGIGVDTSYYSRDAIPDGATDRLRRELGVSAGVYLLLVVARLAEGKHHEDILKALKLVTGPAHLVFAGEGPLLDHLARLADDLGIGDRVHFLGYRSDVAALIGASEATIVASEREGLSRFVLESMSVGVPIVGSDIRGVRELVGDDQCGILFPVRNVEAMATAINRILASPELAKRLGSCGQKLASQYDLAHVLDSYGTLYETSLEELRTRPEIR